MSHLDDFLLHNLDGYLSYDLRRMSENDANGEGVGYPLLMSTCAGIELLGALLSSKPFQTFGEDGAYFESYWTTYMYPPPSPHTSFADGTYQLLRHGIAHTFLLKGEIGVLRRRPDLHFTKDTNGVLIIDAIQLAEDFLQSYRDRVKLLLHPAGSAVRASMELRLGEMEAKYQEQATKRASAFAMAPFSGVTTATTGNAAPSSGSSPGSVAMGGSLPDASERIGST